MALGCGRLPTPNCADTKPPFLQRFGVLSPGARAPGGHTAGSSKTRTGTSEQCLVWASSSNPPTKLGGASAPGWGTEAWEDPGGKLITGSPPTTAAPDLDRPQALGPSPGEPECAAIRPRFLLIASIQQQPPESSQTEGNGAKQVSSHYTPNPPGQVSGAPAGRFLPRGPRTGEARERLLREGDRPNGASKFSPSQSSSETGPRGLVCRVGCVFRKRTLEDGRTEERAASRLCRVERTRVGGG